jgi:hypothetical protein
MKSSFALALLFFCAARPAAAEVNSKLNMDIYGFVKTDFIYSDHGTTTNEYRTYAASGRKDSAFRASARGTRFGVNLSSGAHVSGKIEADFYGLTDSLTGTPGLVSDLRLRHAYVTVKTGKSEILAGQTYYPITADIPETLNDYMLGNSGNLYYRAPQLRYTYSPIKKLRLIAAVVRPTSKLTDAEGTHSSLPGVQGKVEGELGKVKLSLAGAAGVWKSTVTQQTGDVSAVVAAFNVPLAPFTIYGEVWTGRNLYDFQGDIGNSGYGDKAVPVKGGYLDLKYKRSETLWFNLVYGVDDPDNSRVLAKGKTRNSTLFANAIVRLYDSVETGLEVSSLNTEYKDLPDRSSMNYQLTVKLLF